VGRGRARDAALVEVKSGDVSGLRSRLSSARAVGARAAGVFALFLSFVVGWRMVIVSGMVVVMM